MVNVYTFTHFRQALTVYGRLSDMETEKWLATLLVRAWTSLDLGSTSCIKRYRFFRLKFQCTRMKILL